jgi:polyhydroxyalkanoate synthesis regulator phasin
MDDFGQFLMGGQAKPNPQANPVGGVNQYNVGNLRPVGSSTGFQQPSSYEEGIKAMDDNLRIYGTKHNINTLRGVISRYAPPQDKNDTEGYINFVAQRTGLKPDQEIDLSNPAVRHVISGPMILMEKGGKNIFGAKSAVAQTTAQPTAKEATDDFSSFLMGGKAEPTKEVAKEKPKRADIYAQKIKSISPVEEGKNVAKGLASIADIAISAVPAAASQVVYAGGRAFGQSPEEATATAQKVANAPSIGKTFGITEDPAYKQEATRRIMDKIGQYIGEGADAISQKTGIPKQDVENMLGTLGVGVGAKLPSPKTTALKLQEQFDNRFPKTAQAPSAKPTMSGVGAAETNLQNRVQVALTEAPDYLKESLKDTPIEKLATEENIKVIENHNKFAKYGLVPTEGQALENTSLMSNEFNARKTDPNLQARFEERDPKLIQGFNTIKEKVSPDVFDNDPIRLASMPLDKLKNDYINDQANIRALYEKANRAAGGSQAPIDIGALRENIINGLKEKGRTRYVPARLQADLDEVLTQGFMTPEQYENFRTDTATIARTSKDPLEAQAAYIIREKLEQVPIKDEFAQYKPLYDEARKAVAALKAKEKNPAYKAAISDTRTPDEIEAGIPHPAANNFLAKHYASNTPQVNIERMLDLIGRNSPEHQALNKLKIDEFKVNSGIRNDKGTVSQANLNKIIYEQNKSNLPVMFDNMTVKDLQDLADVANLSEPRKGVHSVNVSNTEILRQENAAKAAKETAGNIAAGLTESAINMKVPFGGTILRSTLGGMKAERQAKAAAKAAQEESEKRLSPKAGIKLKDIGKE